MKKAYFLALGAAALIGCGGDDDKPKTDGNVTHDMSGNVDSGPIDTDGGNEPDAYDCNAAGVTCADVTGFSVDIDLLAKYYHDHPDATAPEIIGNSCVPNTPVTARYEDNTAKFTETVMTGDATGGCAFTLKAVAGKTIHLIAKESGTVLNTFSQDATVVTSSGAAMQPAHVCTSNPYSAPVGVAATIGSGTTVQDVKAKGICMYGTNDVFQPPFVKLSPSTVSAVTPAGFTVYSMTNPGTQPPTFVQQADSPLGIHGIYNASNSAETTITVTATDDNGTNTYSPFTCNVIPNYITFAPENPDAT